MLSPATNPLVVWNLTGSDASGSPFPRRTSTQQAFEIDNTAIKPAPEPTTWGSLIQQIGG